MSHPLDRFSRAAFRGLMGRRRVPRQPGPTLSARSSQARFDQLARDLAGGLSRRETLRRFALGIAASLLAEFTDLLHGAWLSPAAAAPVASAGSCSSAQANACLQAAQASLTAAVMGCILPAGGAVTPPWVQPGQSLSCLDQVGSQASQAQQDCLGPKAGCPSNTFCSNNACCPAGLVGCGSQCCGDCCNGACCGGGQSCCFGGCVDTQTDPSHCGGCGQVCSSGACVGGVCSGAAQGCCDPTLGCVDGTDDQHCGTGGKACKDCTRLPYGPGNKCLHGTCCTPDSDDPSQCCPGPNACSKHVGSSIFLSQCCKKGCCDSFNTGCHPDGASNARYCGIGGAACMDCTQNGFGSACLIGQCQPPVCTPATCADGCCDDQPACHSDGATNAQNCGTGGSACQDCTMLGDGYMCVNGECRPPGCSPASCTDGCCDNHGTCHHDGASNTRSCGTMGSACQDCTMLGAGYKCANGKCQPPCSPASCGDGCCDNQGVCHHDGASNAQGCGTGGGACQDCTKLGPGYTCVNGMCQPSQACTPQTAGQPCEIRDFPPYTFPGTCCCCGDDCKCTNLDTDESHCGGCGKRCGANALCIQGQCLCGDDQVECVGRACLHFRPQCSPRSGGLPSSVCYHPPGSEL